MTAAETYASDLLDHDLLFRTVARQMEAMADGVPRESLPEGGQNLVTAIAGNGR